MKTYGQIAYEAWDEELESPMSIFYMKWEELSDRDKAMWEKAAEAAINEYVTRHSHIGVDLAKGKDESVFLEGYVYSQKDWEAKIRQQQEDGI